MINQGPTRYRDSYLCGDIKKLLTTFHAKDNVYQVSRKVAAPGEWGRSYFPIQERGEVLIEHFFL